MGEYAYFVWPCYIAVVVIMTGLGFISWKNKKDDEKKLKELSDQLENMRNQE